MTRDEIIRGLRCCAHAQPECKAGGCPMFRMQDPNLAGLDCMAVLMRAALELLEREGPEE